MRRAKIVCTLGPAVSTAESMRSLMLAGMDVARLNMSHGDHADHELRYNLVRKVAQELGKGVGIFADLQGPKIRLERFAQGPVTLVEGQTFTITTEEVPGDAQICGTTYKGLPGDVTPGDAILIDDGRIALEAVSVDATKVVTKVVVGGKVSDNKGINLPGVAVNVPALSDKDIDDMRWALRAGVDMIALSFVRSAADFADVARIMEEEGIRVPVIAKIEKPQAVENLIEIIEAFDGIMVARGDLGVEMPLESVPLVQKRAIQIARAAAKPVIVATQMLESMITAPRPTRAEASDVANAVLDGADALMLSGETSVGEYPEVTVSTMARIIEHVETQALDRLPELQEPENAGTARAVTAAAIDIASRIDARYVVTFTETGRSSRLVARHRKATPILAFTPNTRVRAVLSLTWGVETVLVPPIAHTDDMVRQVDRQLLESGRVSYGERIVVVAGVPPGVPGTTNGMRVHRIGHAIT